MSLLTHSSHRDLTAFSDCAVDNSPVTALCVACSLSLAFRAERRTAEAAASSGFLTHSALFNASKGV